MQQLSWLPPHPDLASAIGQAKRIDDPLQRLNEAARLAAYQRDFTLTARLDKLLANLGYGSRREIQMLARNGHILLDGAPFQAADSRIALTPDLEDRLIVDGERLDPLPGVVLAMHKPLGVTCSHKEAGPLVYDLLPARWRRRDPALSTVGRLDKETSGLLLITDDGAFLHKVIAPRSHVEKRYRAVLARPLRGDEGDIFAAGTLLLEGEDKPLLPATLEAIAPYTKARWADDVYLIVAPGVRFP